MQQSQDTSAIESINFNYFLSDSERTFLSVIQNMCKEELEQLARLYRALLDPPVREQILDILFGGNENDK